MLKKHTNNLLKWEETMITRQGIYWIMSTFKTLQKIATDLRKQTESENPDLKQKINFLGRLTRDDGAKMFFIIEKSVETTLDFLKNAATVVDFDHI